jgi:hypothetical protein
MYLSLYATGVGQIVFAGPTAQYADILGDVSKEGLVLAFVAAHGIESLALYDLDAILGDATLATQLLSFLDRARMQGILEVNAIADATQSSWDAIAAFQKQSKPFDGLVTEIEFWNAGATFAQFTDTLSYVRSLAMQSRSGGGMRLGAYIGWPTQAQVNAMLPLLDRLYVHVYVPSPEMAYAYGQTRFGWIAAGNTSLGTAVDVWPIFSAEGMQWSAGAEHFMGDWLSTHTLDQAETIFLTDWEANPPGKVKVTGFQYYDEFFLSEYAR